MQALPQLLWQRFNDFHFDVCVLLRAHPFSRRTVVVHARLPITGGEDRVPLSKLHLASLLEGVEVPADKRVIVRVNTGRDEGPPPIHLDKEANSCM